MEAIYECRYWKDLEEKENLANIKKLEDSFKASYSNANEIISLVAEDVVEVFIKGAKHPKETKQVSRRLKVSFE